MNVDRAACELSVIRQLMERPVRYSVASGASGVWAGLCALAGLAGDWYCWSTLAPVRAMWASVLVWMGVFLAALAGVLVLTRRREKLQGMPAWSPIKKRILRTILPTFLAAGGLCGILILRWEQGLLGEQITLLPAICMLFYGLALWQVGQFSVGEVRALGIAFLAAGLITAGFFQAQFYASMGLTFGGFHIVYGGIVWARHGG